MDYKPIISYFNTLNLTSMDPVPQGFWFLSSMTEEWNHRRSLNTLILRHTSYYNWKENI